MTKNSLEDEKAVTMDNQQFTVRGAGGVELFAQRWRPDRAPRGVVVLVHGFGEHSDRYGYLVTALTAAGYLVYSFDHRGHGRSPGQRGHVHRFDDFLEDVRQMIARARADEPSLPLFLFGHSVGGLVALDYAIRHPEELQGVVASAPLLSQPNISPLVLTIARLLSRLAPTFPLDTGLDPTTIARDPAEVQRYTTDPLVHAKTSARAAAEAMDAVAWVQAHAGELRTPLLLYHGGADRLAPIAGSRTFFVNAGSADKTFWELPDGFHEAHNDLDREQLFARLVAWLDARTQ
ncbi:alpha/beta hydrolase [Caldilinea sp.]|uniref:alpha/beta hydrolase n=1 Tax=Caldilinea sp. TaxID=2293560 RepID=UPI002621AB09|nr:alpha/beta hydrolase [uncultured Caldilinea sp.]